MDKDMSTVRHKLGQDEILAQLGEEAAELAQAALKMRRAYSTVNPTPVSPWKAYENLLEELADVKVCLMALGVDTRNMHQRIDDIAEQKMTRWATRLRGESE